jgi:hypothetical protein
LTVPVWPFAPVIVIVVAPAVDPDVTVKVTVPPELSGDGDVVDTPATAPLEFETANAPPNPLWLTVNVIV